MTVPATWHTLDSARDQWSDAPLNDDVLSTHLEIGKTAVIEYGTPIGWDATVDGAWPTTITPALREAQLRACRNAWNDGQMDAQSNIGADGYQIPAPFLRWHALVRPPKPAAFV